MFEEAAVYRGRVLDSRLFQLQCFSNSMTSQNHMSCTFDVAITAHICAERHAGQARLTARVRGDMATHAR